MPVGARPHPSPISHSLCACVRITPPSVGGKGKGNSSDSGGDSGAVPPVIAKSGSKSVEKPDAIEKAMNAHLYEGAQTVLGKLEGTHSAFSKYFGALGVRILRKCPPLLQRGGRNQSDPNPPRWRRK